MVALIFTLSCSKIFPGMVEGSNKFGFLERCLDSLIALVSVR